MPFWKRVFGGAQSAPRDADQALRSALLAVLDRDLDGAEQMLTRALQIDSSGIDSFLALARLYRVRGEIGRAIRIHQNLLLRDDLSEEQRVPVLADLASDYRQGGFLRRAIASYEEVLARDPRHLGALRALVSLLADVKDHKRAIDICRRLARAEGRNGNSDESTLYVEMARTAQAQGRSDDARRAVKKALRKDRRSVRAWLTLGDLEQERNRARAALAAWSKVPEIDARSGELVFSKLEATLAAQGRPRDYEKMLREILTRDPEYCAAALALATTLAARGDGEQAVEELQRLLESSPDSLEALSTMGRILLSQQRETEALRAFGDLLDALGRKGLLTTAEKL